MFMAFSKAIELQNIEIVRGSVLTSPTQKVDVPNNGIDVLIQDSRTAK